MFVIFYATLMFLIAYHHSDIKQPFDHDSKIGVLPKFVDNLNDLEDSYGFIIIGAGSGGSVAAHGVSKFSELGSEDRNLLIEAGGQQSLVSKIPFLAVETALSRDTWQYRTTTQKNACLATFGICSLPMGKMMGGSSSINAMIYLRGNKLDYDGWEKEGNTGWGWDNMLRIFRSQERVTSPSLAADEKNRNSEGYLTVSENSFETPLLPAYLEAGKYVGIDLTDLNGEKRTGIMRFQGTISPDGRRMSANRAFLGEAKNLYITLNTLAKKIVFIEKRADGVVVEKNGVTKFIRAKKEILLSAGAIGSPHLLMVSGVGPKEVLDPLGIQTIADLPVGKNLQDHLRIGMFYRVNKGLAINRNQAFGFKSTNDYIQHGKGPLTTPAGIEVLGLVNSTEELAKIDYPDLAIIVASLGIFKDSYAIGGFLSQPKSVGQLTIKSKSIYDQPLIDPNYLDHPEDLEKTIQLTKLLIAMGESPSMVKQGARLSRIETVLCQQPINSTEFAECIVKKYSQSIYHPVGTCRMGKDGVVDSKLKIHGFQGIRILDASIMPSIVSANTNAPVMAIAGRAIEMIREEYFPSQGS